jgi:hypothetical protein
MFDLIRFSLTSVYAQQAIANSLLASQDGGNCDGDDDSVMLSLQALCSKHNSKRMLKHLQRPVFTIPSTCLSEPNHFPAVERSVATSATSFAAESSLTSSCCTSLSDSPSAIVVPKRSTLPCSLDKSLSRTVMQPSNCIAVTDESFNLSSISQPQRDHLPCFSVSARTRTRTVLSAASCRQHILFPRSTVPLPILKPAIYTSRPMKPCTQSATVCSRLHLVSRLSVSVPGLKPLTCTAQTVRSSIQSDTFCPPLLPRSSVSTVLSTVTFTARPGFMHSADNFPPSGPFTSFLIFSSCAFICNL